MTNRCRQSGLKKIPKTANEKNSYGLCNKYLSIFTIIISLPMTYGSITSSGNKSIVIFFIVDQVSLIITER